VEEDRGGEEGGEGDEEEEKQWWHGGRVTRSEPRASARAGDALVHTFASVFL
jgi:hypothetical protein